MVLSVSPRNAAVLTPIQGGGTSTSAAPVNFRLRPRCRRKSADLRRHSQACRKDFSVTSGTLFAFHKLALRLYLAAIVIFLNEVKGKASLAMSRDINVQYKTAFVLTHKLREAMAAEMRHAILGGVGTVAEVDGCYVGGHVRPENLKKDRVDRRLAENQNGKKKCVVVIREREGRTIAKTFASEEASLAFIRARLAKGGEVHADESPAWNPLHARHPMKRVNHQDGYSIDGACTNGAEGFFSRLRRAEIGIYHHIGGAYVDRYAQEAAFREDHRRQPNGALFGRVTGLVAANGPSVDFCGYWQRSKLDKLAA